MNVLAIEKRKIQKKNLLEQAQLILARRQLVSQMNK